MVPALVVSTYLDSLTPTKGEGESLSHPEGGGGGTTCFGVVLTWMLGALTILEGGGAQEVSRGRGGCTHFYPVLRGLMGGGAQNVSNPQFSHFVARPPSE